MEEMLAKSSYHRNEEWERNLRGSLAKIKPIIRDYNMY
jgi:hypothetical protein